MTLSKSKLHYAACRWYGSHTPGSGRKQLSRGVLWTRSWVSPIISKTQVNNAKGILGTLKHTFKCLDNATFLLLYKSILIPHLENASEERQWLNRTSSDKSPQTSSMPVGVFIYATTAASQHWNIKGSAQTSSKLLRWFGALKLHNLTGSAMYCSSQDSAQEHTHKLQMQHHTGVRSSFFAMHVIIHWNKQYQHTVNGAPVQLFQVKAGQRLGEQSQQAPNDTSYKRWSCHSSHNMLCKLYRTLPPPAMGARFTVFGASRPCGPAEWLALLLTNADDVETNPGPTTSKKRVWICDICYKQIHVRKQLSIRCNRIEHWVHLRYAGIRPAQYTDTWTCHLHRESDSQRTTHTDIPPHHPSRPWPNTPTHNPPTPPIPPQPKHRHTSNTSPVPTGFVKPKPNPLKKILRKRRRVRFRSDHHTHQHTHCQRGFWRHHADGW